MLLSNVHAIGKQLNSNERFTRELKPANERDYIRHIDGRVQATLPSNKQNTEMYELISTYQKHNYLKSCRKYRNIPCRYNFGQYFTEETIISIPISDEVAEEEKTRILNRRSEVIDKVKVKINENLDPYKVNFDCNITLSLPESIMETCSVVLTFESVGEILWCDHSNETSWAVILHGTICFSIFCKMQFGIFLEF